MAGPRATVVVVTHNSERWIRACLDALGAQDYDKPWEIVLVDHESRDGTRDIVGHEYPHVRLIEAENRGFGAGNNLGVRHAKGEIVAFVNPDTEADPEWLARLVAPLEEPRVVTTSQILLADQPNLLNTFGNRIHFTGLGFARGHRRPAISENDVVPVPAISGAAFAMRRKDYERLGGFDEAFFLYLDDTDLSIRARRHGFRIMGVTGSRVRHQYRVRTGPDKLRHVQAGRTLILRKHMRWLDRILFLPSLLLTSLLLWALAIRHGPRGIWAKIRGTADGWRRTPRSDETKRLPAWAFAERDIPWKELTESRMLRRLGNLVNGLFWLNTATRGIRRRMRSW